MLPLLAALAVATPASCGTPDYHRDTAPHNYVFFGRDRERLADTAFLAHPTVRGAQVKYTWRELEPRRDGYDFRAIREDLTFLRQHGKRLFVQLQDVSFSETMITPDYLNSDSIYHGGAAAKYEADATGTSQFAGWVARRWDPAVRERFARLLNALAREFDGSIEGIVLPETAIGFEDPAHQPAGFSAAVYADGVRETLTAARGAFRRSCVIIYANFMPAGPSTDDGLGYLRGIYAHAAAIGVGVGGPDILPYRPFQRLNSLPLIEKRAPGVIAGMAVQDGNLADRDRTSGHQITVPELYGFAMTRLRLNYIFWGTEEPYYTADVLPFLRALPAQ